ncbi:MAG: alpha/beta hydrolase [Bacteroidetes bacterium]|nr:alpha/beta hydrolase [Bacteroidota bacterium]
MKKVSLSLTGLFFLIELSAQQTPTSDCLQNNFCNLSLCDGCALPFSDVEQDADISYGKYQTADNQYPGDVMYADENDGTCMPGINNCDISDNNILHYDVYYPADYSYYNYCPLPVVVFVHGGGFSECYPIGNNSNTCIEFAKRGFVCINVSYRIGRRLSPNIQTYPYLTIQQQLAIYRASQDVRGAVRSIIQRQRDQFALPVNQRKPYQIDTNYIFLAGSSAGSNTVLSVAYYPTQAMMDAINNYAGNYSISQALGPIDADYYYGSPDIHYISKIKGVLDQWGSVSLPYSYNGTVIDSTNAKDFFTQRIPVICFHGQLDNVINIYQQAINFAPVDNSTNGYGSTFNKETTCLITPSFKTNGSLTPGPDITTYGSISFFYNILQPLNIPSEIYIDCQAHHGLDADGPNYQSDYGTGYHTASATTTYIVSRAAIFFQNIIGNNAQARQDQLSTHKVFVECLNSRTKCNLSNNDAGCDKNDNCGNIQ